MNRRVADPTSTRSGCSSCGWSSSTNTGRVGKSKKHSKTGPMAPGLRSDRPQSESSPGAGPTSTPVEPPSRNQFNYALKHHLPAHTSTITELIRERSRLLAASLNLGSEHSPGSLTRPTTERVAYGDVTVMTARSKTLPENATATTPTSAYTPPAAEPSSPVSPTPSPTSAAPNATSR